jgi:hypothetical protein
VVLAVWEAAAIWMLAIAYKTTKHTFVCYTMRRYKRSTRTQLFQAIADLIDQRYAGMITKSYLAVLYLAQK